MNDLDHIIENPAYRSHSPFTQSFPCSAQYSSCQTQVHRYCTAEVQNDGILGTNHVSTFVWVGGRKKEEQKLSFIMQIKALVEYQKQSYNKG